MSESKGISYRFSTTNNAYCAHSLRTNSLTVRAPNCDLLVERGSGCLHCFTLRNILQSRYKRKSDSNEIELETKSQFNMFERYNALSKENMQLNRTIYKLEETIDFLQREARKVIDRDSVNLSIVDNVGMCTMIN